MKNKKLKEAISAHMPRLPKWSDPSVSASAGLLSVLAGALASFFTDKIKEQTLFFPLCKLAAFLWSEKGNCHFAPEATSFWLIIALAGLILWKNKGQESKDQNHAFDSLHRETNKLASIEKIVERIQTLPSDRFLSIFHKGFEEAFMQFMIYNTSENQNEKSNSQCIRSILQIAVSLCRSFDDRDSEAIFSANIMTPVDQATKEQIETIFTEGWSDFSIENWLVLSQDLSASPHNSGGEPDASVKEIALPIPIDKEDAIETSGNSTSKVLPGAPWAFVNKRWSYVESQKKFFAELEKSDAGAKVIASLQLYAKEYSQVISSFVCVPVTHHNTDGSDRVLGVLNIHSNKSYIFYGGDRKSINRLIMLLQPFIRMLALLMVDRE